ncbi:MAG: DUF4976 domain-containing protein, partial [Clostridia bacterium]|nr:DUF4976 domain-containing protein [Clostridia bacterium]
FLLRCPGLVQSPGTVIDAMVSACDLYPTLAQLVGGTYPEGLSGVSFLPVLRGEPGREDVIIVDEYGPVRMLRTRQWKYVHRYPFGPHCLYDLENDPGETRNVVDDPANAQRVVEMRRRLEQFFLTYADPAMDGSREGATGSGQLCRPGIYATRPDVYAPIPITRKEQDDP